MECKSPSLSSKDAFQEQNVCNTFIKNTSRVTTTTKKVTSTLAYSPSGTEVSFTSTELSLSTPDTRSTSSKTASSVRVTESSTLETTSSTTVIESTKPSFGSVSTADYSSKSKNDNYIFDTGSPYKNDMRNGYLMLRF